MVLFAKVVLSTLALLPFFVVINTTPLIALDPYKAAAAASFKTVIDSISLGLIEDKIFELDSFSSAIELYSVEVVATPSIT